MVHCQVAQHQKDSAPAAALSGASLRQDQSHSLLNSAQTAPNKNPPGRRECQRARTALRPRLPSTSPGRRCWRWRGGLCRSCMYQCTTASAEAGRQQRQDEASVYSRALALEQRRCDWFKLPGYKLCTLTCHSPQPGSPIQQRRSFSAERADPPGTTAPCKQTNNKRAWSASHSKAKTW